MRTRREVCRNTRDGGNPNPLPPHPPGTRITQALTSTLDLSPQCSIWPQSLESASSSLPSTMDLPTQDVGDGYYSSEDEHSEEAWGRLFPLGESFSALGKDYLYH